MVCGSRITVGDVFFIGLLVYSVILNHAAGLSTVVYLACRRQEKYDSGFWTNPLLSLLTV